MSNTSRWPGLRRPILTTSITALVALSACATDASETNTSLDSADCGAPVVIAPASGQQVGAELRVRTHASSCLTATKCYVDNKPTPVASGAAGDLDQPIAVAVGSHSIACNGWDSAGHVYTSAPVAFAATTCGAPSILSPGSGESTETTLALETSAPACLVATKCYLDSQSPAVASGSGALDVSLAVLAGAHAIACNGWDAAGRVYVSPTTDFVAAGSATGTCGAAQPITAITGPNTSANPAYDQTHFPANFGTTTWISQAGATMAIDPTKTDLSLNPVTPAHVSNVDVHTLIPSRPDLRWFAHVVPWFGPSNHIDIGLTNDTQANVASMITDMKNRGFDGLIVDWYGQGSYEDKVTLLIQQYLHSIPGNTFKLIIMMDKGIPGLSQSVLISQIHYVRGQYFGDANYETEGGKPILMFFGALAADTMAAVKASDGSDQVWVLEGAGSLSESWVDQSFDWTHDFQTGPSATDPYNLGGVASYYATVSHSPKHAFGSMAAGFNGTLTKTVAWSKGKYLPRGHGACVVEWANRIDQVIPANVTRMQWATWSDWEEGTQVEGGVENDVAVHAAIAGSTLSWTVTTGTSDETTIDHYEIYASTDGVTAIDLGAVPSGTHAFALGTTCLVRGPSYTVSVIAVGRPMIRDHASSWLPYTAP